VILSRAAFARLPVSAETKIAYTRRELAQLRAMLEHSKGAGGLTVKRLEKQILREEERLQALLDSPRDPGVELEQTGIDYLIVDLCRGRDYADDRHRRCGRSRRRGPRPARMSA
jgi:N12 class adenine-specific DNA methylase